MSRRAAHLVIDAYGEPAEATESMLAWHGAGRAGEEIVASKAFFKHSFPAPHIDAVQSFIDCRVPVQYFRPLAEFDGSVVVDSDGLRRPRPQNRPRHRRNLCVCATADRGKGWSVHAEGDWEVMRMPGRKVSVLEKAEDGWGVQDGDRSLAQGAAKSGTLLEAVR